jgi:hypothetical protein
MKKNKKSPQKIFKKKKFKELDLTKGRGWFLSYLGAPMIF